MLVKMWLFWSQAWLICTLNFNMSKYSQNNMQTFFGYAYSHTGIYIFILSDCFCRILKAKKPPNTASTAVGYCSRIPQQINMYSVQLHFILSIYRIIVFILDTCLGALMKRFLTLVFFCPNDPYISLLSQLLINK